MAAQFCPQCGREVSTITQYCPGCGAPQGGTIPRSAQFAMARPAPAPLEAAAEKTGKALLPLAVTAAVVLALVVAFLIAQVRAQSLLLAQKDAPGPSILTAPAAKSAQPLLTAPTQPATPAPSVLTAATPQTGLPDDVAAYLKFLQGIEARRVALDHDYEQAGTMMALAQTMQSAGSTDDPGQHNQTETQGTQQINQGFADYVSKFNTLSHDFNSMPPPDPCKPLANAYYTFLTDYVATVSKLQVAIQNHDLGSAMGAQGSQTQMNTEASTADGELGKLCSSYGAPKPFAIQGDNSATPLLGM